MTTPSQNSADPASSGDLLSIEIPQDATPYARVLYNRIQAFLDRAQEVDAFNVLLQLLKETPKDPVALSLTRTIGQRIYKTVAGELPQALSSGNLSQIANLVSRLRMMADESQLAQLPGYRTAADKVDEAERKYWTAMLLSGMSKMRDTANIKDREAMAISIEKFAVSKKLQLNPEQKAALERVHADWKRYCHIQELKERFAGQAQFFAEIGARVDKKEDLKVCRDDLVRCYEMTSELRELPETEDFLKQIDAKLKYVRSVIFAQIRRKALIRSVAVLSIALIICCMVTIVYAYTSALNRKDTLNRARAARNLTLVQEYAEGLEPLRGVREMLCASYAEELAASQAWLGEHARICNEAEALEPELKAAVEQLNSPTVTPEQMTAGLMVVDKARSLSEQLDSQFNRTCSDSLSALIQSYSNSMEAVRPTVLSRFTSPPAQLTIQQLQQLGVEYQSCRKVLNFTDAEDEEVMNALRLAYCAELKRLSAAAETPEKAEDVMKLFDEHTATMKLDAGLRTELQDYARRFRLFTELPQKLMTVKSLQEHADAIRACGDCYDRVSGAMSADAVAALIGKETLAMRTYKLNEFAASTPLPANTEDVLTQLQLLRGVYFEGKPLYDIVKKSKKHQELVDDLTKDPNRYWRKGLVCTIGGGKWVHTGYEVKGKKGSPAVQQYTLKWDKDRKPVSPAPNQSITPLRLADCRETMGFTYKQVNSGAITPAQLLMNVARFEDAACPVYARAFLFRQTARMIEEMDKENAFASGVWLSPSLKADLAAFWKLKDVNNKVNGCWLLSHKLQDENIYTNFFNSIKEHDYKAEILKSILPITDSECCYAGFIDASGKAVRTRPGDEPLYLIRDGVVTKYEGSQEAPYTPLFVIIIPAMPTVATPAAESSAEVQVEPSQG